MSIALAHPSKDKPPMDNKTSASAKSSYHHYRNLSNKSHSSIVDLQQTVNNQAVQRILQSSTGFDFAKITIQPKLKVSQPGDSYEQEADRVAEQVMRISSSQSAIHPLQNDCKEVVDRKCAACEMNKESEEEKLQISSKPSTLTNLETTDKIANEINGIRSSEGSPLDSDTRGFMESRFGFDFRNVRIHADERAQQSARLINARAFTIENHITIGEGQYAPRTLEGQKLLAHELTHVIQQGGADPKTTSGNYQDNTLISKSSDYIEPSVSTLVQRRESTEEADANYYHKLEAQQRDNMRLVDKWHTRYLQNLETNARHARAASERFINFEESAINDLRILSAISGPVGAFFGTPGAVVELCIIVLTEVAAENLSSKSAKIAATARRLEGRHQDDIRKIDRESDNLIDQIQSTTNPLNFMEWGPIWARIANSGVPEIVTENVIYRELLLAYAKGGGYNVSGSQWNVLNMSLFGSAPWYHSWDWGSPGWRNGRDIADELNALAQGDPSTRINVNINPP